MKPGGAGPPKAQYEVVLLPETAESMLAIMVELHSHTLTVLLLMSTAEVKRQADCAIVGVGNEVVGAVITSANTVVVTTARTTP